MCDMTRTAIRINNVIVNENVLNFLGGKSYAALYTM